MVCIIFYVSRSYSYKLFSRATDMLSLKGYIPKNKKQQGKPIYSIAKLENCPVLTSCNNVLTVMTVFKYWFSVLLRYNFYN